MNAPLTAPAPGSLRRYFGEHEAHVHAHVQVLFGVQGCLELEVEGRAVRVDASVGLLVPAGMRHGFESRSGASVWVIDTPDAPGAERLRCFALGPGWSTRAPSADLLQLAGTAARVLPRRTLDLARLEAAVGAQLHGGWSTARMAALFNLSVPRFHARWLALTGLTPQAWLRRRRLERAERLLRDGRQLEATALAVGYRSASALAFALRRDRGASARGLRRR